MASYAVPRSVWRATLWSAFHAAVLHETGSFVAPDGTRLFTRRWAPELTTPVLTLALVHGVHEHSGRYAYVALQLIARGIETVALDLRGHGQSDGARHAVDRFDAYVDDVAAWLSSVRPDGRPLVLMGHSMGGLVVARYASEHGTDGLAGVVLSSPALAVDAPAPLRALAPLLGRWLPDVPASRLDLDDLSRDPRVGRAYADDPLCTTRGVRARLGAELLAAQARVLPERFGVPLYLFHGADDRITAPAGTRALAAAVPTSTLRTYEGLRHETLNEPERDAVIADLADWLVALAGEPPGGPLSRR